MVSEGGFQRFGEHRMAVTHSFALPDQDLIQREIEVLHPNAERLQEPHAGSVEERGDEARRVVQLREDGADLLQEARLSRGRRRWGWHVGQPRFLPGGSRFTLTPVCGRGQEKKGRDGGVTRLAPGLFAHFSTVQSSWKSRLSLSAISSPGEMLSGVLETSSAASGLATSMKDVASSGDVSSSVGATPRERTAPVTSTRPINTLNRPSFDPFFACASSILILFSFRPITRGSRARAEPRRARNERETQLSVFQGLYFCARSTAGPFVRLLDDSF